MSHAERLRVLHVLGGLTRGGVETWLLNIMRAVDRRRFEMHFLVHSEEAGAYEEEVRALGGVIVPCPGPWAPWRYGPALRRILHERGPYDIVHSHVHHFSGFVLRVAQAAGVATRIAHSHTDTSVEEMGRGPARRLYVRIMGRWIRGHATAGFAASREAAADLFGPGWETDPRWRILYYGIDLRAFTRPVDRRRVRRLLGLPVDAVVIGHVGRFVRQKNHAFLLDVLAESVRRDARVRLLLVGEGPLRGDVEREVQRAGLDGRVVFAGARPDVPQLMRGAMDVFVLPSRWEGLPIVLLEAQAAGLPCVLSDVVSEEADVFPGRTRRLSLDAPARRWARAVEAASRAASHASRGEALARMTGGRFDIRTSARELEHAYRRLARAAAGPGAGSGGGDSLVDVVAR